MKHYKKEAEKLLELCTKDMAFGSINKGKPSIVLYTAEFEAEEFPVRTLIEILKDYLRDA